MEDYHELAPVADSFSIAHRAASMENTHRLARPGVRSTPSRAKPQLTSPATKSSRQSLFQKCRETMKVSSARRRNSLGQSQPGSSRRYAT